MPSISLAALLDARPNAPFWGRAWVEDVFARRLDGYRTDSARRLLGWSVGTVIGPESLVQSRPIVRGPGVDPVEDLLRTPAPCTIAVLCSGEAVEAAKARELIGVGRFRRWVSAQAGPELPRELRRALRDTLPDFLARDSRRHSDAQLVLLSLLAELHARGQLNQTLAPPEVIRAGLHGLRQRFGDLCGDQGLELFVTDGRTLGILHGRGTLLAFEPPPEQRPARRIRLSDGSETTPASLILWSDSPAPDQPVAGAERIAPGVLSVQGMQPTLLRRDAPT